MDSVNSSRSCRDFDASGPVVTVLDVCVVGFEGYHPKLQCCNNKTGVVEAYVTKSERKFILPVITIL